MFVDKAKVSVKAGNGGNGAVSFRHEKWVDRGGPDGGDGGRGGNVVFIADENLNTLLHFRYKQELQAENGQAGGKRNMHGKNGADLLIRVPVGTLVFEDGQPLVDLAQNNHRVVVAQGGDGGFGNAHFTSSVRQAPRVAEVGEKGQVKELTLELKLLADVGLVGFPNAGKSTFLSVVSNARPEVADYPFTTLTPHLGVAAIDDTALLIADIPGLIEGASEGKGLGGEFLRHIERTAVLLHLIDIYTDDVAQAYQTIREELQKYSPEVASRPEVVALTKAEGLDDEAIEQKVSELRPVVLATTPIVAISAQAHQGIQPLLRLLQERVSAARQQEQTLAEAQEGQRVIELSPKTQALAWQVAHEGELFRITGSKIEKFAARTDFANPAGVRRLWDIMRKMGILHELERQGIAEGMVVFIGRHSEFRLVYGK